MKSIFLIFILSLWLVSIREHVECRSFGSVDNISIERTPIVKSPIDRSIGDELEVMSDKVVMRQKRDVFKVHNRCGRNMVFFHVQCISVDEYRTKRGRRHRHQKH